LPARRYRAFISYSHRDERLTRRLHRRLESFRVPAALRTDGATERQLPARLGPVFRDREDLASSARLSGSIEAALDAAEALIVVCSPAAVASHWVGQEIRYFREKYPERPVLAFVVAGDPTADPRTAGAVAAFPRELLFDGANPDAPPGEPLAADARSEGDGFNAAFLKLAAGLLGVPYDALRRREMRRRQQRWMLAIGASLLLSAVMSYLAWDATLARDVARRAQSQAELELESERQTRNFLLSVFRLADAERARQDSVTVREVLDRAVKRIDTTRFSRPAVKSRFLATMGQAYSSLGLHKRSVELMQQSLDLNPGDELSPEDASQRIENQIELADVYFAMGEYDKATQSLDDLASAAARGSAATAIQLARAANIMGDVQAYRENDVAALAAYNEAIGKLAEANASSEEAALVRSRSVSGLGFLLHFSGDYDAADRQFLQAIELLEPVVGELHPATIQAIGTRGSNAYASGRIDVARAAWNRALSLALQVYDENGPEIGTLKNNLGLLELEAGALGQAETLLRAAVLSDRKHRSEEFDDLSYTLNNLAWTRRFQGDLSEARALWEEALPIAEKFDHPMLGPILAGLAELDCEQAAVEIGSVRAQQAVAAAQKHHGAEHWRSAAAEMSAALCAAHAGEPIDRAKVGGLAKRIQTRWAPASPFHTHAKALLRATSAPIRTDSVDPKRRGSAQRSP